MKFNPLHSYSQAILINTECGVDDDLMYNSIKPYCTNMKMIIPKELLHRVIWEVRDYVDDRYKDALTAYRKKFWKFVIWRYEPLRKEKRNEGM